MMPKLKESKLRPTSGKPMNFFEVSETLIGGSLKNEEPANIGSNK